MMNSPPPSSIDRSFRDLSDEEVADIETVSTLVKIGWSGGFGWDELLRSRRVLIVSEAGTGKTYECQTQQAKLWDSGEPAFFLDLATLSGNSVRAMLDHKEEERFDAWLRSQSELATFFLDSIDELKLTLGKFDQALKRLNKAISGQLGRVRIIVTTRPVPIDRELIVRHLPVPEPPSVAPSAEAFADLVMDRSKKEQPDKDAPKIWRNVGLIPLSRAQMRQFALAQGVVEPDALLTDIQQRDANEFAQRPQDLIELCSDWREHHRIRSHREQVETNIATKLKPGVTRRERSELSQEDAINGASRLALAAMLTRKLTLRHSADSDSIQASEAALDVSKILPDWGADARDTLLERPLFGFASYGRVRFHHRSVVEYLAAKRLNTLLEAGHPVKSIKRLLFAETAQGSHTVRPSMRPVAAWLSLWRDTIFDDVIKRDPAVVLDHGDPQSLQIFQRVRALDAFADRYGHGGWLGLHTPRIQIHRFASAELGEAVKRLWVNGIENPEVRELFLRVIAFGRLADCADIAYSVATDKSQPDSERNLAIEALVQLNDPRLEAISISIETDTALWPSRIASSAILDLFPTHVPVSRLSSILRRIKDRPRSVGDLNYELPRAIEAAELSPEYLDQLRGVLTELIREGVTWDEDKWPHLRTKRPDLLAALIAACRRQATEGIEAESWVASCLLAVRLSKDEYDQKKEVEELSRALATLSPAARERSFWSEDAFLAGLHRYRDAWHRVYDLTNLGGIQLSDGLDNAWVRKRLSDASEPLEHREMMLWVEVIILNRSALDQHELLNGLKPFVSDAPALTAIIESRLKPEAASAELARLRARSAERNRKAERHAAANHESWVRFWREIVEDPDTVFAKDRAENTAWNLWRAMARSGEESRASGWNRRFIEEQFGKDVADRLRRTMMTEWRNDKPTLRSERPMDEKNTFLVRWQFGLAGVAAEAENANWAKALTEAEAELACRYAPIELNGFPSWLETLAVQHPRAVDRVLGNELSVSLSEITDPDAYSMFLQNISHASAVVAALFVPRIRGWIVEAVQTASKSPTAIPNRVLGDAIQILMKSGSDDDHYFIETTARNVLADGLTVANADVWLSALLQLNAAAGIESLEQGLEGTTPSKLGIGVKWIADLFQDFRRATIDLRAPGFTPALLLRLLRLAYRHVRLTDDSHHEGSYTPDMRDHAEYGRNAILNALLASTGPEGWSAKLEMAADPLFEHIRDRVLKLALERSAEEADTVALTEHDIVILDKTGESPPMTTDAMFALMRDRLDDVDDLLLQDVSPRALWATISDEHIMRRELARVLRDAARQSYTVDQESVTADEKETDIRLRSTGSSQQGTIELKLGDERSGQDLFSTIKDQLLVKYMAADDCRAGCLLVTIARQREWHHPVTGGKIGFEDLMAVLNKEAERLSQEVGGIAKLMAKGLDLRPRLAVEDKARSEATSRSTG